MTVYFQSAGKLISKLIGVDITLLNTNAHLTFYILLSQVKIYLQEFDFIAHQLQNAMILNCSFKKIYD